MGKIGLNYLPLRKNFLRKFLFVVPKSQRHSTSSLSQKANQEQPVIVMSENDDVDIIGPPNSTSNLRPIIRKKLANETELQRKLREMQNATQSWNQEFWANHNTKFMKERQEYTKSKIAETDKQLSADEMSEFYKSFLDKNWERHLLYNYEWYKKNVALLILSFRVSLEKSLAKFR